MTATGGYYDRDKTGCSPENFRKYVSEFLRYAMSQAGRTIPQLVQDRSRISLVPGGSQSRYGNMAVWYNRTDLVKYLAEELKVNKKYVGSQRISADFYNIVDQELAKLRNKEIIVDWNLPGRAGVFRLQEQYHLKKKPAVTLGARYDSQTSAQPKISDSSTEDEIRNTFVAIIARGSENNTYKFALARALLEYCKNVEPKTGAESYEVPYDYLAGKFLEYYWYQDCVFRIKQDFYTKRMPNVITAIRDAFGNDRQPANFGQADVTKKMRAKKDILKSVFGHARSKTSRVVPKFQKIREGRYAVDKNVLYGYDDDKQMIYLKPVAFEFLKRNNRILSMAVLSEWAKFLEKINGSLPRLIAKIEHEGRRGSLATFRKMYCPHVDHCFYCCNKLEWDHTHVDHFLPWSYIFEDEAWNLVLACQDCNHKKSDLLPQSEFQDNLIRRNQKYQEIIPELNRSLELLTTERGWVKEIENHYNVCRDEYGFGCITMP